MVRGLVLGTEIHIPEASVGQINKNKLKLTVMIQFCE